MKLVKTKSFRLATINKGNKDAKKLALALPGRLDTKDYACFAEHINFFASKGFFALSFDPPGTWESPGGVELFTTSNYIQAVNELIEYFGNRPTFLMGHSRGGAVTILAGASNPAVTAIAPVMATYGEPSPPDPETIKNGIEISYRDFPPGTSKTHEQKVFALPLNYFIDGQKYNVIEPLRKCIKPKLLFYGTNDEFTEPEEVKEVFRSIPDPKIIHELVTNHDYRYYPEIVKEVNKVIGKFLLKNE